MVDFLDGTCEFIMGLPEWSISVGLVEDGVPVAGGICNLVTGETFLSALGHGVTLNDVPARMSERQKLAGSAVLASRSEVKRGQWAMWDGSPFEVIAMGSVAYKLTRVAGGLSDATWTLVPKHEWTWRPGSP